VMLMRKQAASNIVNEVFAHIEENKIDLNHIKQ